MSMPLLYLFVCLFACLFVYIRHPRHMFWSTTCVHHKSIRSHFKSRSTVSFFFWGLSHMASRARQCVYTHTYTPLFFYSSDVWDFCLGFVNEQTSITLWNATFVWCWGQTSQYLCLWRWSVFQLRRECHDILLCLGQETGYAVSFSLTNHRSCPWVLVGGRSRTWVQKEHQGTCHRSCQENAKNSDVQDFFVGMMSGIPGHPIHLCFKIMSRIPVYRSLHS